MRRRPSPLLCELHAHTTWSDGTLSMRELVDLYGRAGFDVLAITDHTVRLEDPWLPEADWLPRDIHADNHDAYLAEVEREAARAHALYDLLVLPGLELTWNDLDANAAGHAVAVGLRRFVGVEDGLEHALVQARALGAALIAAHPYGIAEVRNRARQTQRFAADPALRELCDRWELFNRDDVFAWVASERLPTVASGDFHSPEHLATWKTLLPCEKSEDAVVHYLKSGRPTYLARLEDVPRLAA
jgi:3',5'-nucleoside bisphosphate phosphatase